MQYGGIILIQSVICNVHKWCLLVTTDNKPAFAIFLNSKKLSHKPHVLQDKIFLSSLVSNVYHINLLCWIYNFDFVIVNIKGLDKMSMSVLIEWGRMRMFRKGESQAMCTELNHYSTGLWCCKCKHLVFHKSFLQILL